MPPYADLYVLASARSAEAITRFLKHFAPNREETADEYESPAYAPFPTTIFADVNRLIDHLVRHPTEEHAIYWRCIGPDSPAYVMTFFTADEALILGLSCEEDEAARWGEKLRRFVGTSDVLFRVEECLPDSAAEFRQLVEAERPDRRV